MRKAVNIAPEMLNWQNCTCNRGVWLESSLPPLVGAQWMVRSIHSWCYWHAFQTLASSSWNFRPRVPWHSTKQKWRSHFTPLRQFYILSRKMSIQTTDYSSILPSLSLFTSAVTLSVVKCTANWQATPAQELGSLDQGGWRLASQSQAGRSVSWAMERIWRIHSGPTAGPQHLQRNPKMSHVQRQACGNGTVHHTLLRPLPPTLELTQKSSERLLLAPAPSEICYCYPQHYLRLTHFLIRQYYKLLTHNQRV